MGVVSIEVAQAEVTKWLDFKKVLPKKREDLQNSIDNLAEFICEGKLSLDENTCSWVQNLSFPLGQNSEITTLTFKPRISVGTVYPKLQNLKSGDSDGRFHVYIATLTDQAIGIIRAMDSEDLTIAQNIAVFFL